MRGRRQRGMDGDDIRLLHQLLEGHEAHTQLHRRLGRYVGIETYELHLEALGPLGHLTTHAAQPHDAQGLAVQLDPGELGALPFTLLQGRVGPYDVPGQGEHHGHGVLSSRDDVGRRGVHDQYAAASGRLDINVVDAHARPADHFQVLPGLHHVGGDLGARADDQRVIVAQDAQ